MNKRSEIRIFIWIVSLACNLLPLCAQTGYITNYRDTKEDLTELDLNGCCGLLIISPQNDLDINITNVVDRPDIQRKGPRADGLFEYFVIVNENMPKVLSVVAAQRGSVFRTKFTSHVKPDKFTAHRVEVNENAIEYKEEGEYVGSEMNPNEGILEFTTKINNLQVEYPPELKARIIRTTKETDRSVTIIRVFIPIQTIKDAKSASEQAEKAYNEANQKLTDKSTVEEFDNVDLLEKKAKQANAYYDRLSFVEIYGDGTNRLPINIANLEGRKTRPYAVVPLIIEKYQTEYNGFMNEGRNLWQSRKYIDAKVAYENALKAKDAPKDMLEITRKNIADCDTCILYDQRAATAITLIMQMKKEGNATQSKVAQYAFAAIECMELLNRYCPSEIYEERIGIMRKLVDGLPLNISFTIVEWKKSLEEGDYMEGVEIWKYEGNTKLTSASFPNNRAFNKMTDKESSHFQQLAITDKQGVASISLDRKKLPANLIFRPREGSKTKIKVMDLDELIRLTGGDYKEQRIRLKMNVK